MAMEKNTIHQDFVLEFSPQCLSECDSIRQIIITPDCQNALIAEKNGVVSSISFVDKKRTELIRIPRVPYLPLVSAATKRDSLLVAAAGNYFDKVDSVNKAECHIWCGDTIKRYLSAPLQAITLDKKGHFLVMVSQSETVAVRNLETHQVVTRSIWSTKAFEDKAPEYDIDIVCDDQGNIIIVAREHSITVMKWNGSVLDLIQRHNSWEDNIERVFLPQSDVLIYMTRENLVKKIELCKINDKTSKPVLIFESLSNREISIDEDNDGIMALWTKDNNNNTEYLQRQIVVCKKGKKDKDEYLILAADPFSMVYNYLTVQGTKRTGRNYWRDVAIRGNSVVALSANGMLYWWSINLSNKKEAVNAKILRELLIEKESPKGVIKKGIPHLTITGSSGVSTPSNTDQLLRKITEKSSLSKRVPESSSKFEQGIRSSSDPNISPRREGSSLDVLPTISTSLSPRLKQRRTSPSPLSSRGKNNEEENKK